MAVKVTIGESKTQNVKPFPKLMVSVNSGQYSGRVVLMLSDNCGIVLKTSGKNDYVEVGHHCTQWNMCNFEDFNDSITLQND